MSSGAPTVVIVTEMTVVDDATLLQRLERTRNLAPEARSKVVVSLRDPSLSSRALLERARWLRRLTASLGMRLTCNDRLDVARAINADGVHLGSRSVSVSDAKRLLGPNALVSVACHSLGEVEAAGREGADLALLSPIFASPGKGPALGIAALREAVLRAPTIAVIALGGIDLDTANACLRAGAAGVASIRADLTSLLRQR